MWVTTTTFGDYKITYTIIKQGELAQLARALHLHCRGHQFESDILH